MKKSVSSGTNGTPSASHDDAINALQERIRLLEEENATLKQKIQQQNTYLNAFNEFALIFDEQGYFIDFYTDDEQQLYLRPDDFVGKKIFDIFPPPLSDKYMAVINDVFATNTPVFIEYRLPDDDTGQWFRARCAPIQTDSPDKRYVSWVASNISEEKQAQTTLTQAEARFRTLSLLISDFVYHISIDAHNTMTINWNYGAVKLITGYTIDEIKALPNSWVSIVHPDDLKIFLNEVPAPIVRYPFPDQAPLMEIEYRIIHKNGSIRWLRDTSQEQVDQNTQDQRVYLGTAKDITDEIEIREALIVSEKRFRDLTEQFSIGVIETLRDGTIIYANPALVRMFEYPSISDIYQNKKSSDLYKHDRDRQHVLNIIESDQVLTNYSLEGITYTGKTKQFMINSVQVDAGHYLSSITDISDVYRVQKMLLNYRTMVSVSLDAMALVSKDFQYLIVNQTYLNLWQIHHEDIIGKYITDIMSKEMFHRSIEPRMNHTLLNGEVVTYEEWFVLPSGRYYFSVNYTPVYDDDEHITGLVLRAHDLTATKQSEERLQHYQTLTSNTQDIMALVDKSLTYIACNPAYAYYWGKRENDIPGTSAIAMFGKSKFDTHVKPYTEKVLAGVPVRYQEWRDFQIGKRYMDISYTPIYTDKNEIYGFTVVGRDLTDVYEAETISQNVLMTAQDGYWLSNTDGNILDANQALCDMLGYTRQELLTMTINDLEALESDAEVSAHVKKIVAQGADNFISKYYRKDRRIIDVDVSVNCQTLPQPRLIAFVRDITETVKAQNKMQETFVELEYSNQRLQQFAYIASHDLQEPLRMVTNYLQLLERRYGGVIDDRGKVYIDFATDGAKRMYALINDLLEFSRVTTHAQDLQPISMQHCFDLACNNLQLRIQYSNATIIADPLPDDVYADEVQMIQVWQNLLTNALKFANKTDPLKIVAKTQKVLNSANRVMAWQFSLQDNGIGIAPEYHQQIFSIFRRLHTREEYEGTGIGLAVCERIIERHHGRIWVESELGQGATFYFTIPVMPES